MQPLPPTSSRSHRGPVWAAICLVLLVMLVVPSAAPSILQTEADASPVPDPEKRILLLHDSVANGARVAITDTFADHEIEWVGFGGLHVYTAVELLRDRPDLLTSHVIIELGTNYDNDADEFRDDLYELMEILGDAEHVLWLKPSIFRKKINDIHAEIDAATRRYPNLHAVDWGAVTAANTSYTTTDDIHMVGDGKQALADFMYDNLTDGDSWNRIPQGKMTKVRVKGNRVTVKGWAFDPDVQRQIKLQIIVDGKAAGNVKTKRKKPNLAKRLEHESNRLGYSRRLTLSEGQHTICVLADNKDGLDKIVIGCQVATVK